MTSGPQEDLAVAIGMALGGGDGHPYEAESWCQQGNVVERYSIAVHPNSFYWSSTNLRTGRKRSFDPQTMSLQDGEDTRRLSLDRIPRSFDDSVKLAFPSSLSIWGRQNDDYHPVSVEELGDDTVLLLRHTGDRAIFGSYTFDRGSGKATRLVTPTQVLRLATRQLPQADGTDTSFGFVAGSEPKSSF